MTQSEIVNSGVSSGHLLVGDLDEQRPRSAYNYLQRCFGLGITFVAIKKWYRKNIRQMKPHGDVKCADWVIATDDCLTSSHDQDQVRLSAESLNTENTKKPTYFKLTIHDTIFVTI